MFQHSAKNQDSLQNQSRIKVFCRLKPLFDNEKPMDYELHNGRTELSVKHWKHEAIYKFDHIFTSETQDEFVRAICDPIPPNGTLIFSYGITNAGKTYSILGEENRPGILPYLISSLGGTSFLTAVELYNDEFYSLFTRKRAYPKERLGRFRFEEAQEINSQNVNKKLRQILRSRTQAETEINRTSSRSHAIFRIENKETVICVVDLAGSERVNNPNNETCNINKSLLCLGRCLTILAKQDDDLVVPYRDSKLTRVLMEYFIHHKIIMVLNIQPVQRLYHENINVLDYSVQAKGIRIKKTRPHVSPQNFVDILKKIQLENTFKAFESSQQLYELYLEETFKLESQLDMMKIERIKMDVYRSPYREPYREERQKEIKEAEDKEEKEDKKDKEKEEDEEKEKEKEKEDKKDGNQEERQKNPKGVKEPPGKSPAKEKSKPKKQPVRTPLKKRLRGANKNKNMKDN